MNKFAVGCVIGIWLSTLYYDFAISDIAANIKVIRETVVQQAKECHNLDTMEVKNK